MLASRSPTRRLVAGATSVQAVTDVFLQGTSACAQPYFSCPLSNFKLHFGLQPVVYTTSVVMILWKP